VTPRGAARISRRGALRTIAAAGAAAAATGVAEAREPRRPRDDDAGMLFDATRCVGCRACQTACREANELPYERKQANGGEYDAPLDLSGSTKTVVKLARGDGESAYVKTQCMHCADPACASVCMAGALHRIAGGVVAYDPGTCVGCRYCQVACPFSVPRFQWFTAFPAIVKCELCRHRDGKGPACAEVCPRGAVVHGRRGDLLAEARRRIAAAPDRYHPAVYGERDGGGTGVLYVTSPRVSFAALGLPTLPDHPLPQTSETVQHGVYAYGLAPIALWSAVAVVQLRARRKPEAAGQGREEAE
jgi:Fe-S-cluster-containing dehydrogenase component